MIRDLRIFLVAALALAALGAIAASAHAADEFHCSVSPCRVRAHPDGNVKTEGKTAHQVFVIENVAKTKSASFTCETVTGEGTISGGVATAARVTNIAYPNCTVGGSTGVTIDINGCEYNFAGAGGRTDEAQVKVECPGTNVIEFTAPNCTIKIGPQTLKGVGYHTVGVTPNREVTITGAITTNIAVSASGTGCEALGISPTESTIGTYTTGNVIATGENAATEAMADAWYE